MSNVTKLAKPNLKKGKGVPPPETDTIPNTQKAPSGKKVQIPVMAPPEMRRQIKADAAERDMSVSELMLEAYTAYINRGS